MTTLQLVELGVLGPLQVRQHAAPVTIPGAVDAQPDLTGVLGHLDAGEDSVGTKVNWEHVGPALLGAEVTLSIKLTGVDGRRVTFEAFVNDGADAVARGTHERFIVDVQKVRERLLRKAKRG